MNFFTVLSTHSKKLTFLYLLIYVSTMYVFAFNKPEWGDEIHFVETVQLFASSPFWHTLGHYEEMSTPLPFMLYASWGKLFGMQLHTLRLFSIIIATITYLLFFSLFSKLFKGIRPLLYTLFLTLNPYMIGLSVFVFTDMSAIFFTSIFLHAILNRNPYLIAISIAGALLCRQYFIFLPAGAGLYYLFQYISTRESICLKSIAAVIIGTLPLFALVLYWHGLSPLNETRTKYHSEALVFHGAALSLYVSLIVVYCFPVLLIHLKKIYANRLFWIAAIPLSSFQFFFPIKQPIKWVRDRYLTTGFFHEVIALPGSHLSESIVFYICFFLSLPVIFYIFKLIINGIREKCFDIYFLCQLITVLFLITMPLSYLLWEKYFIPVIAFIIIGLERDYFRSRLI